MFDRERTSIGILGAGIGGKALLELFTLFPGVEVIGIADSNAAGPALECAHQKNVPVLQDIPCFIERNDIDLIMNVTGDPRIDDLVSTHKHSKTEILGGAGSSIFWNLIQQNTRIQAQLFQAEKLAGLGTFASGIAHDINNPLYVMVGLAENILEEQDIEVIREQAQTIVDAGKRIQMTCRNITQYARAADGMEPVNVELTHALNEAIKIAQYVPILQDVKVVKHYASPIKALANPEELLQVFVNLLTNAIHAMKGKGTLTLSSWSENGFAKISITDTGCGIPSENLEKIFEPFFTTKASGEGTGLGLHNVRDIIKKYHGVLTVESQVGKGTTFLIQLPTTLAP